MRILPKSKQSKQSKQPTKSILERSVGQKPGSLTVSAQALPPRLFLVTFNEKMYDAQEFGDYDSLMRAFQKFPEARHWIDVRGYGNVPLLERIMIDFQIHPLQMEDVINDYQRPKVEEDHNRLFIVSRMVAFTPDHKVDDDQLSIFTGSNYVITFQSDYEDCLDPLRERIRVGKGAIRKKSAMYVAYAILDVVLDHYFPAMAQLGEYAEELEDCLFENPSKKLLSQILDLKREVVKIRRIVWPERDKINEIMRMDEQTIPHELKIYFKDIYDHAIQLIDLVDNYKEITSSLTDLYLSNVSNRMNEVMKVLTIISTIFIPLSFIVGLYGMNFSRENPRGGINPLNMPELYHPYGYVTLLCVMGVIVSGMVYYFYRKGWLSNQ
ncbi:magnesium/cobalt transporter CorA [Rufibacter latericius]|uniref:Magnesium transport protein CorA n=1 Tax=Rufibacter latericius TaxID=2487040 RepID=A0A3M9N1I7_9BACT|nr:magnesium/cobalt transporter CorA [Rufibacter latericius]RNI31207.1 magnesium and cobalt transport protein CorA [Rufibacter latericius]